MIGMGKFVDFFRDRVLEKQSTLGAMEDVLKVYTYTHVYVSLYKKSLTICPHLIIYFSTR